MATLSTFISLPVSIPLGAVFLGRASISGAFTVLTKKYQSKLTKVTKWVDIVTSAISVFGTSLSKALKNGEIDEREFQVLQDLHLKVVDESSNVDGISGNLRQGSRIHCLKKCCFLKDVNNSAYCSEIWPTN